MADNDWSVQLKKIEREFEGLPPEPSPAFKKLQSEEERRAQERAQQRVARIGAGARLILVFALFGALTIWPYANDCGWGLFSYIGAEAVIVAGGLWVAFTTWRARLPKMHTLSLLIILVGLILIAAEVLPRTGYASGDPTHPPQLWCPETKAAQPSNGPETKAALPSTDLVEQRFRYAAQSMESRWQESSGDLVRQLRPQRAALARIAHPELRLQPGP
ncbi:MAG: hypothetical protein M3P26_13920 [Gemmatimonadota bacterium]|nr:hypothetical protein [Gemmatimonadota bacterium]